MSPKQLSLYWREWAAVRRARPAADRHALHTEAIGYDVSHRALTNEQFDLVLGTFRAISRPTDLQAQLDALGQPRRRLLWAIGQFPATPAYLGTLLRERFHASRLSDLSLDQLQQLRYTLVNRFGNPRNAPIAPTDPF
jgi:hypothetical protein